MSGKRKKQPGINEYYRMLYSEIVNICFVRFQNGRPCKDCIFYGSQCEQFKHRYGCKPYDIENKIYERED